MIQKYYHLDECKNQDIVYEHLESLQDDSKIYFEKLEDDIIRIKDTGLSDKECKSLVSFFEKHDVLQYVDIEDDDDDFFDDDDNDESDYDNYDDY